MANIKISELNELTKSQIAYDDYIPVVDSSASETKKISVENLTANNVYLLAVVKPNGQVPTPVAGAKYYNELRNKIYYAPDDEHWYEYGTPVEGIFYVVLGEKGNYAYDSENETLVSVGGGSGSEIVIGDEEPTEDTKMIIDTDAFDPQYSDITDEYSEASNKAYSCDYINSALTYSTDEVNTHKKWIDGKDIYRKAYQVTLPNSSADSVIISGLNNIEVINISGMATATMGGDTFKFEINSYHSDTWLIVVYNIGTLIRCKIGNSFFGASANIILEYTKTTDQGGNN